MKRLFFIFLALSSSCFYTTNAQYINYEDDSGWSLGLNIGTSYQTSDIKRKFGGGAGFTIGHSLYRRQGSFLSLDLRFRYLFANNYGQDTKRSYGLLNNSALNGTDNAFVNYNNTPGYVYQNYKMQLNDFSLEGVITLNSLRESTGIILQGFGGIGLTQYSVYTNQQDALGMTYDYTTIDTLGSPSTIETQLNSMMDNSYESQADGNAETKVKFMPSLGVALGYQFTPHFSMGIEHRVTFALSDDIDGQLWADDNSALKTNDRYNYTTLVFRWRLGRTSSSTTYYDPPNHNETPIENWTTPPNNTVNTPPTTIRRPVVNITDPNSNPYNKTTNTHLIRAKVFYIDGAQNITFKQNGNYNNNFTYNPGTNEFVSSVILQPGSNIFEITATNDGGSDNASTIISFQQPQTINGPPPVVTITNPISTPHNTTNSVFAINATVLNISTAANITFTINNQNTTGFTYNTVNNQFSSTVNLQQGNNTISIVANNNYGQDSKTVVLVYNQIQQLPPPSVNITTPIVNPLTINVPSTIVTATVMNISSSNNISLSVNNIPNTFFTFSPYSHQLQFTANNLVQGTNVIFISATNSVGTASDNTTIIYSKPAQLQPPVVTIITPNINPKTINTNTTIVKATILNITSSSNVSFKANGAVSTSFTFNATTLEFSANVNLILGTNIFEIKGINSVGNNSKMATIIFVQQGKPCNAPVITISQPGSNPYNTSSDKYQVTAGITNIVKDLDINFTLNGHKGKFLFDEANHTFKSESDLVEGANVFEITASNRCGTITKTVTIIYTKPVSLDPPEIIFDNPSVFPHTATSPNITLIGRVLNVSNKNDITLIIKGVATTNFSFDSTTKHFDIPYILVEGATTFDMTAVNSVGSDHEAVVVNLMPTLVPPVISVSVPETNPYSTTANTQQITFTVDHITAPGDVQVVMNGTTINSLNYTSSNHQFSFNANLQNGLNTADISATTPGGSDFTSVQINYDNSSSTGFSGSGTLPTVTITNPSSSTLNVNSPNFTVTAATAHATSVKVMINGSLTTNYSFASNIVTIPVTLIIGANTIGIRAINTNGTADAGTTITYTSSGAMNNGNLNGGFGNSGNENENSNGNTNENNNQNNNENNMHHGNGGGQDKNLNINNKEDDEEIVPELRGGGDPLKGLNIEKGNKQNTINTNSEDGQGNNNQQEEENNNNTKSSNTIITPPPTDTNSEKKETDTKTKVDVPPTNTKVNKPVNTDSEKKKTETKPTNTNNKVTPPTDDSKKSNKKKGGWR